MIKKTIKIVLIVFTAIIILYGLIYNLYKPGILPAERNLKFIKEDDAEYIMSVKTTSAQYYFSEGTKKKNRNLVHRAEIVLDAMCREYNLNPPPFKIYFTEDEDKSGVKIRQSSVTINPNDMNQYGMLFFYANDGKLPAWLCAGLELYWLDEYGVKALPIDKEISTKEWAEKVSEKGLPEIGDEWFVPGLITDELSENIYTISYAFVKYLNETNRLKELTTLFIDEDRLWDAENIRENAWRTFTGQEPATWKKRIAYRYLYDMSRSYYYDFICCVKSVHGKYYFTRADWTREIIMDRIEMAEDSIEYVKDWFGYIYERPVEVVFTDKKDKFLGGYTTGTLEGYTFTLFDSLNSVPSACAHEAVHLFLRVMEENKTNFPRFHGVNFLEEGLANAIMNLHAMEGENHNELLVNESNKFERWSEEDDTFLKCYEKRTGSPYVKEKFDFTAFVDLKALFAVNYFKRTGKYGLTYGSMDGDLEIGNYGEDSPQSVKYGYLFSRSYQTASSFVLYLLQIGTKEDFRNIYADINRMEEIYGKDMEGMIEQWINEYLYVPEWVEVLNSENIEKAK